MTANSLEVAPDSPGRSHEHWPARLVELRDDLEHVIGLGSGGLQGMVTTLTGER